MSRPVGMDRDGTSVVPTRNLSRPDLISGQKTRPVPYRKFRYSGFGFGKISVSVRDFGPKSRPVGSPKSEDWHCGLEFFIFHWQGFNETNYSNPRMFVFISDDGSIFCHNGTIHSIMSLRFTGPLETMTPSISIYSGANFDISSGIELTFTGLSATNFGFVPKYAVLTGRSSWTGFENEDFTGNATCFETLREIEATLLGEKEIRSFAQGCNDSKI
ncbi:hypothetical protein Fcan01_22422 [Folsomia candida]|uniref:Uncharacterized protein n=1 Tax=Folsomia candida TaxID=158441 RepID=A0A226DBW7_FOLCA|nr:hypothetical protein Fcan01_22422 [Folsomia candida]